MRITASGKVVHHRAGKSHLMSGKGGNRVRRLRKKGRLAFQVRKIRTLLLGKA
jgi:ribosomal protein L35